MLKLLINRSSINKACNAIFDNISYFFAGNSKQDPDTSEDNSFQTGAPSIYVLEWDLHQGVSDILMKDIRVSVSLLLPSPMVEMLNNVRKRILLYFYIDIIEEEKLSEDNIIKNFRQDLPHGIKDKVIFYTGSLNHKINKRVIFLLDWWKTFIRKLEIFLKLEPECETFYLIGDFSPHLTVNASAPGQGYIHNPDQIKLKSSFLFHKRN